MAFTGRGKIILIVVILLAAGAAPGVWVLDHLVSRPDRIEATADWQAMLVVRDELMHYENEHGVLPRTLEELAPAYVQADQLTTDGQPLYRYDLAARKLIQANGSVVRGLTVRQRPALEMVLADPESAAAGKDLIKAGSLLLPQGPELPEAPTGALVWEAEQYTDTNYGWEIHPDPTTGGGAYIHCKEGVANGPAQLSYHIGDFYDIRATHDYTRLVYHFRVPKTGKYYLYGRMWTTDTTCSNSIHFAVDRPEPYGYAMRNTTPFRWVWTEAFRRPIQLKAGDHFISAFIHEDGVSLDQLMLSPTTVEGGQAYRVNFHPGQDTAWVKSAGPPVHVSFDLASMVISGETPPDCKLVIRKVRPAQGPGTLRVTLLGAGAGDRDWQVGRFEMDLGKMEEVSFLPLSFAGLDLGKLERKEYLLRAEITQGEEVLAQARVPLLVPFLWQAAGPFQYMTNEQNGPLDRDLSAPLSADKAWRPLQEKHMDIFGVLDFGLFTSNNSAHAPSHQTIYARTRVHVPQTGEYLFKIQSDDYILLWMDGKRIFGQSEELPVTRSARTFKVTMTAGDHELRMRVNQIERRWQAVLRIRTADDDLSNVTGLAMN